MSGSVLRRVEDRRLVASILLYPFAQAAAWAIPEGAWAVQVPVVLFLCFLASSNSFASHNAVHTPVFRARWLNKVFQIVASLGYPHPVASFVPLHNLSHHAFLQQDKDVMRTSHVQFSWQPLNFVYYVPRVISSFILSEMKFLWLMLFHNRRWYLQFVAEMTILYGIGIALLVHDWPRALAFWILPQLCACWLINAANLWQHDGTDADSRYNHSRNFHDRFLNWWGFNFWIHTIHHNKPWSHWSDAPRLHAEEIAPHIAPGLEQRSLLRFLWRAYGPFGKREDYLGNPYTPPPKVKDGDWAGAQMPGWISVGSEHGEVLAETKRDQHLEFVPAGLANIVPDRS